MNELLFIYMNGRLSLNNELTLLTELHSFNLTNTLVINRQLYLELTSQQIIHVKFILKVDDVLIGNV